MIIKYLASNTEFLFFLTILFVSVQSILPQPSQKSVGIFIENQDIGMIGIPGTTIFNKEDSTYIISASGENMWFEDDAFHYVWIKVNGNIMLEADIEWIGKGRNPHRKAGLIIRQNLNSGSKYVDAIVHGDGLTSLQYREFEDSLTNEIQSNNKMPSKLGIVKEGKYISMLFANKGDQLKPTGSSIGLSFEDPYYIGLGVCSHDNSIMETAMFSNVKLAEISNMEESSKKMISNLETINIDSKNRKIIFTASDHIEAPNWSSDNCDFIFNSNGLLYKIPIEGGDPQQINTGFATNCNNDHGISPCNKLIVISDQTMNDKKSRIYILPYEGGNPRLVTPNGPSYWHGWSPDGTTLAYCAERDGEYDVYTIPVEGGEEQRLTSATGLDDGPDYSPCGQYIYFNSNRTGTMQIWRMKSNGEEQVQITFDEYNDWFPHPSPDGKWLVFLSYEKDIEGHPPNKDVILRILSLETGKIEILTRLFGGQGTINVPSWSPDSKNLAFVSYFFNRIFK